MINLMSFYKSLYLLYLFKYFNGIDFCLNLFDTSYILYILLGTFSSISLSTRFLEGTSFNSDKYISNKLFYLSRISFFLFYFKILLSLIPESLKSTYIFYIIPLYLPYYLDGGEFTGSYRLPSNHIIKKLIFYLSKHTYSEIHIKNPDLYIDKPCILGLHPHGLIPFGVINNLSLDPKRIPILSKHLPQLIDNCFGTGATFNFFFPIIREFYLLVGAIDCSKPIIKKFLNKNYSIVIMVGGGREARLSGYGRSELILNKRYGFFKLALETGHPLIPIYTFGENNYYNAINEQSFILFKLFHRFTGLWFPFGYLSFRKHKIITVIGDPVFVDKINNPTLQDILNVQNKYKKNLIELFNTFKYLDPSCKDNELIFLD